MSHAPIPLHLLADRSFYQPLEKVACYPLRTLCGLRKMRCLALSDSALPTVQTTRDLRGDRTGKEGCERAKAESRGGRSARKKEERGGEERHTGREGRGK